MHRAGWGHTVRSSQIDHSHIGSTLIGPLVQSRILFFTKNVNNLHWYLENLRRILVDIIITGFLIHAYNQNIQWIQKSITKASIQEFSNVIFFKGFTVQIAMNTISKFHDCTLLMKYYNNNRVTNEFGVHPSNNYLIIKSN